MKSTGKQTAETLLRRSEYGESLLYRKNANALERVTFLFALIMLSAFPLMMGPLKYGDITHFKFLSFQVLTLVYLGGVLFLLIRLLADKKLRQSRKNEGIARPYLSQILLFAFTLWGVICALKSPYGELWEGNSRYEGVLSMLLYSAIFLAVSRWGEYNDLYLPALAVTAVLEAGVCLPQIFGSTTFYPEDEDFFTTHFLGTLGNIDMVGGFVAIVVPALICGFVLLKTKWRYLMLSGGVLLFAVELLIDVDSAKIGLITALAVTAPFLLTRRRHAADFLYALAAVTLALALCRLKGSGADPLFFAALIAAPVLALCAWLLGRKKEEFPCRERTLRLCIAAAELLALAAALFFIYRYEGENLLLSEAHGILHGEISYTYGSNRGFVWLTCLELIKQAPVFGCGPGAFYSAFYPYNRVDLVGESYDFAHNEFLQIGVCMGYVGMALYIAFVLVLVVRAVKYAPRCPLVVIFAAAVAGYLAHSFFSFSIAIITPIFWVMAGLLEKLTHQIPPQTE